MATMLGRPRSQHQHLQLEPEDDTAFWDPSFSITKVGLTRTALAELDRQNNNSPGSSFDGISAMIDTPDLEAEELDDSPTIDTFNDLSPKEFVDKAIQVDFSSSNYQDSTSPSCENARANSMSLSAFDLGNGIHLDSPQRPSNIQEIDDCLNRRQLNVITAINPRDAFDYFEQNNSQLYTATNSSSRHQDAIKSLLISQLYSPESYPSARNLSCDNLASVTETTILHAKPDFCDGSRLHDIKSQICEELAQFIIPSRSRLHPSALVSPNLFLEVAGQDTSLAVARQKACLNGVAGARGLHHLRAYQAMPSVASDGQANTVTSTYHDGTLEMYTVHPISSADSRAPLEYHMSHLRSYNLTRSHAHFLEGLQAITNVREWANVRRKAIIDMANKRVPPSYPRRRAAFARRPPRPPMSQRLQHKMQQQRHRAEVGTQTILPAAPIAQASPSRSDLLMKWKPHVKNEQLHAIGAIIKRSGTLEEGPSKRRR